MITTKCNENISSKRKYNDTQHKKGNFTAFMVSITIFFHKQNIVVNNIKQKVTRNIFLQNIPHFFNTVKHTIRGK